MNRHFALTVSKFINLHVALAVCNLIHRPTASLVSKPLDFQLGLKVTLSHVLALLPANFLMTFTQLKYIINYVFFYRY